MLYIYTSIHPHQSHTFTPIHPPHQSYTSTPIPYIHTNPIHPHQQSYTSTPILYIHTNPIHFQSNKDHCIHRRRKLKKSEIQTKKFKKSYTSIHPHQQSYTSIHPHQSYTFPVQSYTSTHPHQSYTSTPILYISSPHCIHWRRKLKKIRNSKKFKHESSSFFSKQNVLV
jgi:hypothetical protein